MSAMNHQDFIGEHQWVEKLRQGKEQGFEEIYKYYWAKLYSVAYNYTRNREVAQEIVQELFVSLWLKRSTLPDDLNLKSYLFKAIRNKIYDFCDKQTVRDEYARYMALNQDFSANTTEQQLDFEELNLILNQQIDILPEKTRQVFILSRVNGYSIPEIAVELQLSVKTVEYHLSKALKYLRFQLTELLLLLLLFGIG
jgi:RNA polymerase sigma-70 factor (ECF subfamily)